jgi:ADP-ribose pyrophosphatase YjhB (NUDIX family)
VGRFARLARLPLDYAGLAWWGLVSPRIESEGLVVLQAVVLSERGVLLALRRELQGWELPGGTPRAGESDEAALRRELREEAGLEVCVESLSGVYVRSGFRPHTAKVFRCRVSGGELRPSHETPRVGWFPADALPATLLPWFRGPLLDALRGNAPPLERHEHQGIGAILAGLRIDLVTRWRGA